VAVTTPPTTTATAQADATPTTLSADTGSEAPQTDPPPPEHSPYVPPPQPTLPTCTPGEQKMQDIPGYGYVLTQCDPSGHLWNVVATQP
jgi:hypothetical protein